MQTVTIDGEAQAAWVAAVTRFHSEVMLSVVDAEGQHHLLVDIVRGKAPSWKPFNGFAARILLKTGEKKTDWPSRCGPISLLNIRVDERGQLEVWSGLVPVAKRFDSIVTPTEWPPGLIHAFIPTACDPTALIGGTCLPLPGVGQLKSLELRLEDEFIDIAGLAKLTQLNALHLNGWKVSDLRPLASLSELSSLCFASNEKVNDLGPLACLGQLTTLELSGCTNLSDLGPLGSLTQLTSLDLSGCENLGDIASLANLTQLTSLNLSYCQSLDDIASLASLTQLTSLDLSGCENLRDLGPLASLTRLTSLNICGCGALSDVGPLASLTQLTSLDLSVCENLSDLGPLASLTRLTSLNLCGCGALSDVGPLASLTQLTSLDLSDCKNLSDLRPLAGLTQLPSLDFSSCASLSDLGPLASLTQLTKLEFVDCGNLSDLGPLANLTRLASLSLWSCARLTLVAPIADLPTLSELDLEDCANIRDADSLCGLPQLRQLKYAETATRDAVLLACAARRGDCDLARLTGTSAASFELSKSPDLHARHLVVAVEALVAREANHAEIFRVVAAAFRSRGDVPLKTWEALLAAVLRAPDPQLRQAFEAALEHLPLAETEHVLGPALLAMSDAPASARDWALDLAQRALLPVAASATHAREVAPAAAVFFHAHGRTEDVDKWLERGTVAQVPAWRDRVLVALLGRALRTDGILEARRLLGLVQTPERRDEARSMLVRHLAEKAEFRDAAAELDAIVDRARRASAAAQALSRAPAFAGEPQAGLSLLLALDGDPDTLADVLTAMVQQAPDCELAHQLVAVFAPTDGVDLGDAVDALLAHEAVTARTKPKLLAGLRTRVRADRKLAHQVLVRGAAALLAEEGLVDDDEAAEVTAALLGRVA